MINSSFEGRLRVCNFMASYESVSQALEHFTSLYTCFHAAFFFTLSSVGTRPDVVLPLKQDIESDHRYSGEADVASR